MKAFLLKDLLTMRRYLRSIAVILVLYLIFFFVGDINYSFVSGILMKLTAIIPTALFSVDEIAKWDNFGLTLPVDRGRIVLSRYLITLLFSLCGLLLSWGMSLARGAAPEDYPVIFLTFLLVVSLLSITLPLLYRFGGTKGRMILIVIFAAAASVLGILEPMGGLDWLDAAVPKILCAFPAAAAALFLLANLISLRI